MSTSGETEAAKWRNSVAVLLAAVVLLSAAIGVIGALEAESSTASICIQTNTLRAGLTNVIVNAEQGLPANAYFKQHPAELRAAQAQYRYDLRQFRQIQC